MWVIRYVAYSKVLSNIWVYASTCDCNMAYSTALSNICVVELLAKTFVKRLSIRPWSYVSCTPVFSQFFASVIFMIRLICTRDWGLWKDMVSYTCHWDPERERDTVLFSKCLQTGQITKILAGSNLTFGFHLNLSLVAQKMLLVIPFTKSLFFF